MSLKSWITCPRVSNLAGSVPVVQYRLSSMCTQYVGSTQQVCGEYTVHDAGLNNPRFIYSLRKYKYLHNTVESLINIRIILPYGSFTHTIYYAITTVITIRFKNGLCTHFRNCDLYFPTQMNRNSIHNRNRVINLSCEWTLKLYKS